MLAQALLLLLVVAPLMLAPPLEPLLAETLAQQSPSPLLLLRCQWK
jgi:hypothetical protein